MFFMKWLISAVVSLIACAGIFALVKHFMQGDLETVLVASLSSLLTSIVAVFTLFPQQKQKKKTK